MKLRKFLPILLIFAIFCTGCVSNIVIQPTTEQTVPVEKEEEATTYEVDTLKLAGGTDWGAPSPFLNSPRGPGTAKMKLVFGSLLEKDETQDVSWLAKSWSIEGNDYTFTLFDGLTFHDGQPLTTADVAFTLDYYRQFPAVTNYLGAGDGYIIDSYEIQDDLTIVITVTEANADTLSNLGNFVILPKHIWENVDDPYSYTEDDCFIGSGAYTFSAYDGAAGAYEFLAFDGWVNGTPAAEKVQFVPVSDEILAFENGEIDYTSVPADLLETYSADESVGLLEKSNDMGYKMLVNFEKLPVFSDLEVRQAVYAAIDRQSIVDKVFRGAGSVGSAGYVPQTSLFYSQDVTTYEYDPTLASQVLAPLNLELNIVISDTTEYVSMAEIVKLGLEQAGCTVTVSAYDSATLDSKVLSGDYEFAMVGNGGWGSNPPSYLRTLFSDNLKYTGTSPIYMGALGYENPELTELAEAQQWETDFDVRMAMFGDIQEIVSQEIPLWVLATQSDYEMYRKDYYDGWMKTYAYQQASQNRLSYMSR